MYGIVKYAQKVISKIEGNKEKINKNLTLAVILARSALVSFAMLNMMSRVFCTT